MLGLEKALEAFKQSLGDKSVEISNHLLQKYSQSTSSYSTMPSAIVFPKNAQEVSVALKIANEYKLPVYPISQGKNWGYGDACAAKDNQVILDLSRMNQILEVNTELAYVVVEPGVTQEQLTEFLASKNIPLWIDATGAGPQASLVGNVADRGFGHTRYGDHFANTCGMEVALADGRLMNTGFGHFKNAQSQYVYRYGVGPVLDGLFCQGNFGVITKVGLWLMPEPEAFTAFFFSCPKPDDLEKVIETLRPLKLQGLVQSAVHIANDIRTFSSRSRYPFEKMNQQTPLNAKVREEMRKEFGIGHWNACGSITGSKLVVKAIQKNLKKELSQFNPIFLNDKKLDLAEKIVRFIPAFVGGDNLRRKISIVKPTFEMLKGKPVKVHLSGASWRVRGEIDNSKLYDPIAANAGIMWTSPLVPMTGRVAREIVDLLEPIYNKHGFDFLVTFTLLTDRALVCVTNVAYDSRIEEEAKKAHACYEELSEVLMKRGYYPYRVGPWAMDKLKQNSTHFWDVVNELKSAIDPNNIIAPGRYS